MATFQSGRVAVVDAVSGYGARPPFDPPNPAYDAVVRLLELLELDAPNAGSPTWNPLGAFVRPGQHVVIKPNFVSSKNFHQRYGHEDFLCCCTHPSLVRPVVDLAWRALEGRGTITIAEAPLEGGEFSSTLSALGVNAMLDTLRTRDGVAVELVDLRHFQLVPRMAVDDYRIGGRSLNIGWLERQRLSGDPRGYRAVDLGHASSFAELGSRCEQLRFHHSNPGFPSHHHQDGRHDYSIGSSILAADLIVNMPKMKTHKKAGVTLGLKNMFGTSNEKYWLPHFTAGGPPDGDEYPSAPPLGWRLEKRLSRVTLGGGHAAVFRCPPADRGEEPHIYDGNWSGNDTVWRTVLDLNRAVRYADRRGILRRTPQRAMLTIIDGVVAGEGNGPLAAVPRRCGVLVGGTDVWACDMVTTRMMGVDPAAIKFLGDAVRAEPYPVTELRGDDIRILPPELDLPRWNFKLPCGWEGARAPDARPGEAARGAPPRSLDPGTGT